MMQMFRYWDLYTIQIRYMLSFRDLNEYSFFTSYTRCKTQLIKDTEPKAGQSNVQNLRQFVGCLPSPATLQANLRDGAAQTSYVLPNWTRSSRSNLLSHPVAVFWHRANPSTAPLTHNLPLDIKPEPLLCKISSKIMQISCFKLNVYNAFICGRCMKYKL